MAENPMIEKPIKMRIPFTKTEKIRLILMSIGFCICVGILIYIEIDGTKQQEINLKALNYFLRMTKEQGYAEGQIAAIKGDIKVQKLNDTTYIWTSTPFGNFKPLNDTIYIKR
jgi:hypothetical protein